MKKRLIAFVLLLAVLSGSFMQPQKAKAAQTDPMQDDYTLQEIPGSVRRYEDGKNLENRDPARYGSAASSLPSEFEAQYVDENKNRIYTITTEEISYVNLLDRSEGSVYRFTESGNMRKPYITKSHVYIAFNNYGGSGTVLVFNRSTNKPEKTYAVDGYINAVGADKNGNILVSTDAGEEEYPILKINASGSSVKIGTTKNMVSEFVAVPGNGMVYYNVYYNWVYWGYDHTMCGLTYASYHESSFQESFAILKNLYQVGFSYYQEPVTFFTDTLAMDYLGNVYTVSQKPSKGSGMEHLFTIDRNNHELEEVWGQGCQAAYFPASKEIIGKNIDNRLCAYSIDTQKQIAAYTAKNNIYSVYKLKDKVVSVEYKGDNPAQKSVELIGRTSFAKFGNQTINLNEQACYKNRTEDKVRKKYQAAVKGVDMRKKLLSETGSYKKPYAGTTMSKASQAALLKFSNYQRWLAGLSAYKTGNSETVANTGKGAVLLSVASGYGHDPAKPKDMPKDFYDKARSVTGGNISYRTVTTIGDGINAIRGLTDDTANAGNTEFSINDGLVTYVQGYNTPGHRNTFLQRGGTYLTYGAADGVLLQYYEYVQRNPNESGTIAETGNNEMAYAWPSPGWFPVEETDSKAVWTVYLNTDKVDFGNNAPAVKITDLATQKVYKRDTLMSQNNPKQAGYSWSNFWGKSISFSPPGSSDLKGKSYRVSIGNLKDSNGRETTLEYTIHFFSYTAKEQMKSATLSKTSYFYDGKAKKPKVTVKNSKNQKISSKYYTVTYKNNKNIGKATVIIKGKGKYSGTINKTFTIKEKKGSEFTVKNCKYKITGTGQVSFSGLKKVKASIVIPNTVKIGGKDFKVTSVANKAFRNTKVKQVSIGSNVKTIGVSAFENCTGLKEVTLGKNVTKIGSRAFYGDKKLKTVIIHSQKLKTVDRNALKGIHPDARITVPQKSYTKYKKLLKGKGQGKKVKIVKR